VNDEVSVTELLEREGWREVDPAPKGRMRVVAVMLAVVIGCGLAALLVHFGSQNPQADGPSVFDTPHGPTGGLAGGGVPASPYETDVTSTGTSVVVTNEAAPGIDAIPWRTKHRATDTQTVTVTESSTTPSSTAGNETSATPTGASQSGGSSQPTSGTKNNNPSRPIPTICLLSVCL
jgi:hypothetical protein